MVWWKVLVLCVALLAGSTNAFRKRIFNGQGASILDFPYQASLRFSNRHFCGGSIIGEWHILTAAHCVRHDRTPPYTGLSVVTGTRYALTGGIAHEVANMTVHEGVKCSEKRCVNDIAVIKLKEPIVFDQYQQKINLAKQNYEAGQKAILTGWGLVKHEPKRTLPTKLQMLETKLISMEECQQMVIDPETTEIFSTEVCAFHSNGTGACYGDSGGPLVVNGELIGIVSWVDGDWCAQHPDVFTNVYQFLDFIKKAMDEAV